MFRVPIFQYASTAYRSDTFGPATFDDGGHTKTRIACQNQEGTRPALGLFFSGASTARKIRSFVRIGGAGFEIAQELQKSWESCIELRNSD